MRGNAATLTRRQPPAPTSLLSDEIQDGPHPRLFRQHCVAKFIRVLTTGMGQLVEERFDRKAVMRMANRTPPLHRDANLRRVQIYLEVWNAVEQIRRTFNRGAVNSILDAEGLEECPLHDRLTDDRVRPGHRISAGVHAANKPVVPHWPV